MEWNRSEKWLWLKIRYNTWMVNLREYQTSTKELLKYSSGWWFQPLWKILLSRDDYFQYMEKTYVQTTSQYRYIIEIYVIRTIIVINCTQFLPPSQMKPIISKKPAFPAGSFEVFRGHFGPPEGRIRWWFWGDGDAVFRIPAMWGRRWCYDLVYKPQE